MSQSYGFSLVDRHLQLPCSLFLHFLGYMAIDIQREADREMAQRFGHCLHIHPGPDRFGGKGVPKIMEPSVRQS